MIAYENTLVTPNVAKSMLLKNHPRNRKVIQADVDKYARDMERGLWRQTAEPIKFDTSGYLVDGQNRLLAVIKSGASVKMTIAYGVDPDSIIVIDSGRGRSTTDRKVIGGIDDAVLLSKMSDTLARIIAVDALGHSKDEKLSTDELLDIEKKYYNLCRFANAYRGKGGASCVSIVYAMIKALANGVSEKVCRAFIGCFARGDVDLSLTGVNWKVVNNFRDLYNSGFFQKRFGARRQMTIANEAAKAIYLFANNRKKSIESDVFPVDEKKLTDLNSAFKCDSFKEPWFGGES